MRRPRLNEGIRQGLRILMTARDSMTKGRTRSINALNALIRSNDLGIDARRKLSPVQIEEISRRREREEALALGIARAEVVRLATHALSLSEQLKSNEQKLEEPWSRSARRHHCSRRRASGRWPRRNAWVA